MRSTFLWALVPAAELHLRSRRHFFRLPGPERGELAEPCVPRVSCTRSISREAHCGFMPSYIRRERQGVPITRYPIRPRDGNQCFSALTYDLNSYAFRIKCSDFAAMHKSITLDG